VIQVTRETPASQVKTAEHPIIRMMMVTGVQPAGSRGFATLQGAGIDTKELARPISPIEDEGENRAQTFGRSTTSQPIVFPREGVPLDQRPVANRLQDATHRYADDGGDEQHPDDRNGDRPDRW
jgi:hypothetical protein